MTSETTRRRLPILLALVAVIGVVAGMFWYFVIRDSSPERFSIDAAVSGLDEPTDVTDGDDDTDAASDSVEGAWSVAADAGPGGAPSQAGYRVNEELVDVGSKTVVGRTSDVIGALHIEGTTVTDAIFTVDMESVVTDNENRDRRYRAALQVDRFPAATFQLTEPIELGQIPAADEHVTVTAVGDLTVHGVTRSVEAELDATLSGSTLVVVGSIPVAFSDYEIDKPSAAIVLSLDDAGVIEFQLYLTRD